jgi:thioredoxin-like negative regulator of GroEL
VVDRVLIAAAVAVAVGALVAGGRLLARRRERRLRTLTPGALWRTLGVEPDERPMIVAFSTPGCAACHTAQKPALAALEERAPGVVRVIHVDAAARPEVARAFSVMTVPATVVLDARGAVVAANQGFATTERLAEQVGLYGARRSP